MKRILAWPLVLAVALALGTAPAQAKVPPGPATLATEPVAVDAHLGYQRQKTCSPQPKPGAKALLALLIRTWGGSSSGISRGCNVGTTSEHKEGRALDWHRDVRKTADRKAVEDALKWLTGNNGEVAYRLGIMYIIWDQKIWSVYYQELGWRPMADRGSRTANHKDHVHISLSWDGAYQQTSWWTGVPVTTPLNAACTVCLPTVPRTTSWRSPGVIVPAFMPAPWRIPGIGGSPQVGRTLRVVPGTWVPEGSTLTYQWLADRRPIAGATGETYVVTAGVVGKGIGVKLTAASPDGGRVAKTSDPTTDVLRAVFSAPTPVIAGAQTIGTPLTVQPGAWKPAPAKFTYQWYRGSKRIAGATAASYRLTSADRGKRIVVKVTGSTTGFTTKTVTSAKTGPIKQGQPAPPPVTPTPAPTPPPDPAPATTQAQPTP